MKARGCKGYRHTPEMLEKMSRASKERWADPAYKKRVGSRIRAAQADPIVKAKHRLALVTQRTSEEWRGKMRRVWASYTPEQKAARLAPMRKGFVPAMFKRVAVYGSRLEEKVFVVLEAMVGLSVQRQVMVGPYTVDGLADAFNLAVEVDGTYWHSSPQARAHDSKKNLFLAEAGYAVHRIREESLVDDVYALVDRLPSLRGAM